MIKSDEAIYRFIGLGMKAGQVVSGEFVCEKTIKARNAKLVIVTMDASEQTKKKFSDSSNYYKTEYREFGDKLTMGKYLGKNIRAVIAVKNDNFAKKILEMIDKKTEV